MPFGRIALTRILKFQCLLFPLFLIPTLAQRRPVLPQIDEPHPYYFRELYLPQLTSGPSSLSWGQESKELIYSMAGSLWGQELDSEVATQITDGTGYDYQPDWSPDGKSVVYVSYQKDAMELWLLNLTTGKSSQLTSGGAVNVEPRWSPDGKKIVWVSTQYNRRFHVFVADVTNGALENIARLTGETKSPLPRYYYSPYDMEINPVWTRDGKEILFISNRGRIHSTGGFWLMKADPGAEAREIHYEDTSWKARPDFARDGSRMIYSSYLGRQWQNLWVMRAKGGDAFPISYGDWDDTNARWSPDGKKIAAISNQPGGTAIFWQSIPGGRRSSLVTETRRTLRPQGRIVVRIEPAGFAAGFGRVSLVDEQQQFHAPKDVLVFADDAYDRKEQAFESHYFYPELDLNPVIEVPAGKIRVRVSRGMEAKPFDRVVELRAGETQTDVAELKPIRFEDTAGGHWVASDLHVHMHYGGTDRNYTTNLRRQAEAEGLEVINELIVNTVQRVPDFAFDMPPSIEHADPNVLQMPGQEYHTSYW